MALAQIDRRQAGFATLAIGDRDRSARRACRWRLQPRMSAGIKHGLSEYELRLIILLRT